MVVLSSSPWTTAVVWARVEMALLLDGFLLVWWRSSSSWYSGLAQGWWLVAGGSGGISLLWRRDPGLELSREISRPMIYKAKASVVFDGALLRSSKRVAVRRLLIQV